MSPLTPERDTRTAVGRPARSSREEVVLAALEILKKDGLAAVTLSAVGDRLGLHKVGLYTYVKSKDDLLRAMRDEINRRNLEVLRAVEDHDPHDAFIEVCKALASTAADYGALHFAVEVDLSSLGLEAGERFLVILEKLGLGPAAQLRVYVLLVSFFEAFVTRSADVNRVASREEVAALTDFTRDRLPLLHAVMAGPGAQLGSPLQALVDDMLLFITDVVIPAARNSG